jgi:REP element-mobilizing transposase RayT
MKNHFHLLIRVKEEDEIDFLELKKNGKVYPRKNDKGVLIPEIVNLKKPVPSLQFSHLFNAYAKAFNKRYYRTGSLFEKNFHRKVVSSKYYFKHLIFYIHNNPVHHRITNTIIEYPWSSYVDILTASGNDANYNEVIDWFIDVKEFINFHQNKPQLDIIKDLLIDLDPSEQDVTGGSEKEET